MYFEQLCSYKPSNMVTLMKQTNFLKDTIYQTHLRRKGYYEYVYLYFLNILKIKHLQKLKTPDSEGNTGKLMNSTFIKHL